MKPLLRLSLLLASFLGFSTLVQSKPFYLRSLEVEDGLSQNMVYSILQDRQGFMWFGTQDGLNRYDGQSFTVYKKDPSNEYSIGSNSNFSLFEAEDGRIWVGTANGVYIYSPVTDSFTHFDVVTRDGIKVDGIARHIAADPSGNIWIAVSNTGLFRYDANGELKFFRPHLSSGQQINIRDFVFSKQGDVWIATYGNGLLSMNPRTGDVEQYWFASKSADNDINDLFLLNDNRMIVGTSSKGALFFNLDERCFTPFVETDSDGNTLFVRNIFQSRAGEIWLCTETGVYICNSSSIVNLRHVFNDPYSLSDNAVHSIYQDREDGIWLGTYFGGVNYVGKFSSKFEKYYPVPEHNSISGKSISEFCLDDSGKIWIGTEDAGLNCFDPATGKFRNGFIPATNIHALLYQNGKLWVGSFAEGLFVLDVATRRFKSYSDAMHCGLTSNHIYSLFCDSTGKIWVGTFGGLFVYDSRRDVFDAVLPESINRQVNDIVEDSSSTLWFATLGDGIFSFDRHQNRWHHYEYLFTGKDLSSNMVSCLLVDSRNNLWVGTEGMGLCVYDRERDLFLGQMTMADGLPNDVIYRLVEDTRGDIWGSTNKGLFKVDTNDHSVLCYTYAQGLLGDQFNYKSGFRAKDGKLYFGGIKGFVAFSPEKNDYNRSVPPVVINSFQIYNREVRPGEGTNPILTRSITNTNELKIPQSTSMFSFGFAALSYSSVGGNTYSYMLEGWDKEWINSGSNNHVTYSNLPAGHYTFRVKAANGDGVWNNEGASIELEITPPFYRTTYAYIFYFVMVVLLVALVAKRYARDVRTRDQRRLHEFEAQKEKELYNAKIDFFTNITHEIRTPLSLIKMPLDAVMESTPQSNPNYDDMVVMRDNTNRMMKLINELLDFRKAESKVINLTFVHQNAAAVLREAVARFLPSMQLKGICVDTFIPETLYADIDAEIFTKMTSNLINNALNHANKEVKVVVESSDSSFKVVVSNDGDKILPEYAEKIFQPYFKIDEKAHGTGIGLPFARTLAELHSGKMYLLTDDRQMTTFVIELPIGQQHVFRIENDHPSATAEPAPDTLNDAIDSIDEILEPESRPTILIVEDNKEFNAFVAKKLKSEYNILKSYDGMQAIELLEHNQVDIIITDIMMPVMDGLEFCGKVKENLRFSHIPVIILTAKTTIQSKMECLRIGADEYIEKPFSPDYLKLRINNLLLNRQKIAESFKNMPEVTLDTIVHSKADENFIHQLVEIVYRHIDEVDFDVDTLAAAMNMSRATFYRKVKSISQLTPNDFVRLIRLKKAAELLRRKEYRVNEIAFIVGFSSSSYFSKCFFKQFGVLPKDFVK